MNEIAAMLDKPIFQALGWTLIHFIWQGALIAISYLSLSLLLRRFTPNVRYAAACTAMLLMLVAPVATMLAISANSLPERNNVQATESAIDFQAAEPAAHSGASAYVPSVQLEVAPAPLSQKELIKRWAQESLPRSMPWLLSLWFAGVLFLSMRFAGGLVMVQRLKRIESSDSVQFWQARLTRLCDHLRVSRPVRLCESALVEVPTVVGWLRPVILLPVTALTGLSAEQLEALLAHELAHIRRYDYLVNLLQTTIETLFFYHPAVWWVSTQVRQEREHCCDDLAVVACGDVLTYARALTALEQIRGCESQLAVTASGGSLLVRIQRLLRGRSPAFYGFESGPAGITALATVLILLVGAQAALFSRNARAAVKNEFELPGTDIASSALSRQMNEVVSAVAGEHGATPRSATQTKAAPLIEDAADSEEPSSATTEAPLQENEPSGPRDFKSEMSAAGLSNLSPSQLRALEIHGVTPQFIQEMSALVSRRLGPDDAIAMRIHGVSPAKTNEFKALGLDQLNSNQLIAFGVHGVTPKFVAEMKAAGCGIDPDSLIAYRIHGVNASFIEQMRYLGFANLSGDQLTAFAIHGVTPLFVQTMRFFIPGKLSTDDLLALRIHGVSAEMIKELEIMGFAKLTANQLVACRIHGVTPAYVRSIQDAGYDRITVDQLIELRVFGVTAEFIQMVKNRGFTDVTLHQLAELRRLKILPSANKN